MIDPHAETLVPLNGARIPGNPHIATRWRWAMSGIQGVRLETVKVGGRRFTTDAAIRRFLAALNADHQGGVPDPPDRRAEAAEAELIERGV